MDISGTIQFYDARVSSFPPAIMAPLYSPFYPSTDMVLSHPQMKQSNPFNIYTGAGSAYVNYTQQPLTGFVEDLHSAAPAIKSEAQWNGPGKSPFVSTNTKTVATTSPTNGSNEVNFKTEVDTLMKAIQAKSKSTTPQTTSSIDQSRPVVGVSRTPPYMQASSHARAYGSGDSGQYKLTQKDAQEEASSPKGGKKRYQCTIQNYTKSFYQKTHLDIHERAHTGVKPYVSSCSHVLRYEFV
jgi:hypothetical protein